VNYCYDNSNKRPETHIMTENHWLIILNITEKENVVEEEWSDFLESESDTGTHSFHELEDSYENINILLIETSK
jgi:hypothetical protein